MPPEHNPDEIRQRMDSLRSSLDDDVAQIATSVRAKADWRYYLRNHPWLIAGAATAVGYLLVPRRVEKVERIVPDADALAKLVKQRKLVMGPESQMSASNGGLMSSLAAIALAAGSRVAMGYLSNKFDNAVQRATSPGVSPAAEPPFAFTGTKPK